MEARPTIDLPLLLLDWYREMGVDAALDHDAIDWVARGNVKPGAAFKLPQALVPSDQLPKAAPLARPAGPAPVAERSAAPIKRQLAAAPPPAARAFVAPSPDAAVAAARQAARDATTIEGLRTILAGFDGCGLKATAKNLCFFRGAAAARLMIVGEAPGRDEDLAGTPFAGPAGALLDKMLLAIGLNSDVCHITNAVYWRPPGNRLPTPQELDVCRPFLERQIALVRPQVLVLLGATAAKQMLDIGESIVRTRGIWRDATFGEHKVRAVISHNPNYLLKMPSHKQHVWRDLLSIKTALAQ